MNNFMESHVRFLYQNTHLMESQSSDEGDSSPSPETPTLTYSPSSTDCSSGDRTIQMSTIEDGMFPNPNGSQPWSDYSGSRCTIVPACNGSSGFATSEHLLYCAPHALAFDVMSKHLQLVSIAIVNLNLNAFGGTPWCRFSSRLSSLSLVNTKSIGSGPAVECKSSSRLYRPHLSSPALWWYADLRQVLVYTKVLSSLSSFISNR